jgi:hypothetical protein
LIVELPVASVQSYVVGWSPDTFFVVSVALRLGNKFI